MVIFLREFFRKFLIALGFSFLLVSCSPADEPSEALEVPEFRSLGVKIRVADMDQALDFYVGKLNFTIKERSESHNFVELNANTPVFLLEVENTSPDGPAPVDQAMALQVNDIEKTIEFFKEKGILLHPDSLEKVGVGMAATFQDPFGTFIWILQDTVSGEPPVEEPTIYNFGYSYKDVDSARTLYIDKLGFIVRTEAYYPPALPLGHEDGSFGFMLHLAKTQPRINSDLNSSGTTIIFSTQNIQKAIDYLVSQDIKVLHEMPQEFPWAKVIFFEDHRGGISEIWEIKD